ncbi:iron(III) transport system ATP-binding protein [Paracoccus pantotrophus]|nr:iron(III) transport system ATP-binding protein [Paracoccus pantotrophus]
MTLANQSFPTQAAATPMVSIRNLTKTFQTRHGEVTALGDVSLDVTRGEVLVLLGPSGCGKTTLLRCIAGLEHPTSGEIYVHDRKVFSSTEQLALPPEKRNLSMVFQSYALWPHKTVHENIAYPLVVSKVGKDEIRSRVAKVLDVTGLSKFAGSYPGQLSGGQQQRVALARALVANDGLILFDEPLSNLDAKVRERLRDELIEMQGQFDFTAVYVTHDQIEAAALADRIAVMEVGHAAQIGTPQDIFRRPQTRYVADFVGCSNELHGTVHELRGELAVVQTEVGLLEGVATDPALKIGDRVHAMFRPEHTRLDTASGLRANQYDAVLERSIFLGTHVEHIARINGQKLALRSMKGEMQAAGTPIRLTVEPQYISVFHDNAPA